MSDTDKLFNRNFLPEIRQAIEEKRLPELIFDVEDNVIYGNGELGTLIELCATYGLDLQKAIKNEIEPEIIDVLTVKYYYDMGMYEYEDEMCDECKADMEKSKRRKIDKTGRKIVEFRKKDED